MEIKKYKIRELKLVDYNPRYMNKMTYDNLKKSITEFGYIVPIIVNSKTNNIIGGNHRYQILKEQFGDDHEIDVISVDLDNQKEKILNVALNKISGDWDMNKLRDILNELEEVGYADYTGFNIFELKTANFELPELDNLNIKGREIGMRYPLTFWFTKEEYEEVGRFFFNNKEEWKYKTEPNTNLLKKRIREAEKNNENS